ncbi:MAG: DUF262 domain-containing HNH endonuclease family protein [Desulfobulbus sp.]|nr:DUF262 domain-containing HNH endonuclease family protein [Desulfobulbus sp.]
MSKKISGAEYPLSKIFSSDFEYVIPSYQRPYAWTVDQASELFDDLYDFHQNGQDEGYFLGSIVLIKEENVPFAEVIDGQQRLTTLTILLAALAETMEGAQRDTLLKYICEPGNEFEGLRPKPRLTLRERDQPFFSEYIQNLQFAGLSQLDEQQLANESQRNLRANCMLMKNRLNQNFSHDPEKIKSFVQFLLQRCFLVAVSTPSQQSAFRVFSVMNSRGLDLQPTDIIKADIIGQFASETERDEYSERWEEMEVELGRSGFNDLFSYVRMIYAKEKAKRALLEEFRSFVLAKVPSAQALIDTVLEPYATALSVVRSANYSASANAQDVNTYLKWLNKIDNSDWIPPAIFFLAHHKNEPDYVLWFFQKLERLAAFLHICAKNVNERIERYAELIGTMEAPHSRNNPISQIELTESEKIEMQQVLDGNIYTLTARRRNYLLLRLDSFLSDGGAVYDHTILTIEHVLPQTVDPDSEWATLWPDADQRQLWVHRLANLVPLNFRRNVQASNYDFTKKKAAYFGGRSQVSSFILTTQVLNAPSWLPTYVQQRQVDLLGILFDKWEIAEG